MTNGTSNPIRGQVAAARARFEQALPAPDQTGLAGALVTQANQDSAMREEGFPPAFVRAFKKTADQTNCVVMTRVPGKTTATLIETRHDLKGYFIKAKSCNWGPMAGFLCCNPAFNKNGAEGIEDNAKAHEKYLTSLNKDFNKGGSVVEEPLRDPTKLAALQTVAFVQIAISNPRLKWLRDQDILARPDPPQTGDTVVGVAASGDQSIVMEYLLKKSGTKWQVFQGNVYRKASPTATYELYLPPATLAVPKAGDFEQAQVSTLTTVLSGLGINRANLVAAPPPTPPVDPAVKLGTAYYPLMGVQNPYPPYTGDKAYLNAVTGDYDLFTVWPVIPPAGFATLRRVSEIEDDLALRKYQSSRIEKDLDAGKSLPSAEFRRIFLPVAGKAYTLELQLSRDVYIEFIPGFLEKEIDNLENKYYGNISEAVFITAQTLNSLVTLSYQGQTETPNAAFHSDEGGRPGVKDIEYPFAVFLPSELLTRMAEKDPNARDLQVMLIRNHEQFLALIKLLLGRCYISLNHGWLLHWAVLLASDAKFADLQRKTDGDAKLTKYLEDRATERQGLPPTLRTDLVKLLTGVYVLPAGVQGPPAKSSPAASAGFQALMDTFAGFLISKTTSAQKREAVRDFKIVFPAKGPQAQQPANP